MYHPQNEHIFTFNAINNHVLAHGKAPRSNSEIPIACTSHKGVFGQQKEPVRDGVNQPGSDLRAAAFLSDINPDVVQVGLGPWRYTAGN